MPTTTPDLYPYPVLTDTADVPRDVKAHADRSQAVQSSVRGTPAIIRVRNPADRTGFGSGVQTNLSDWTQQYLLGPSGVFTFSAGTTTVQMDGIYTLSLQMTALATTGTPTLQGRLWTNASTTHCMMYAPAGSNGYCLVSASTTVFLTAGTTIIVSAFSDSGVLNIRQDGTSYSNAYTITRLSGS